MTGASRWDEELAEVSTAGRTSRMVEFQAARAAEAPLTWGQQALWAAIRRTRPADSYFNYTRRMDVGGHTVDEVLTAIGAVVSRHEALRTRLSDESADPLQRIAARGTLDVELVDPSDVDSVVARFEAQPYAYDTDWPIRAAIVVDAGTPVELVLGFCHLAADFTGSQIALADVADALAGKTLDEAPQPAELATAQRDEKGLRTAVAALAYWEGELRRIPPTMFPERVAPAQEPPFWTGEIASPALGRALTAAAARTGIGSAAIMVAACAALTAQLTGDDLCAMLVIVANRFRPERRELVSTLSMEGLVVVGVDRATTFADLARRTWGACLQGYRFAEYPEAGRDEVTERISAERGVAVHPYCCYNDLRAPGTPDDCAADGPTTFAWTRKLPKVACRFCLHIHGAGPDGFRVSLTADTSYIPPDGIERYLYALERLLIAASTRDVDLHELDEMMRQ
jgi:hypothetical protein